MLHDVFILSSMLRGSVAYCMAVLSNWESFSALKLVHYASIFLKNINQTGIFIFFEKNGLSKWVYGQYQNGHFFDFLEITGIFKTGIFWKNEKRAFPKQPFFENLI